MSEFYIRIKLLTSVLLFVFCAINGLKSQERRINFEHITTEDGLNQNSVLDIYQDKDGFLWFGSYEGINRFDGFNISGYTHNYINNPNIADMHVRSICEDTSGIFFVGTMLGLNRFFLDTKENVNYNHNPNDPESLANDKVFKVFKDSDGDVWLCTMGGGLDRLERIDKEYASEQDVQYRFIHHQPSENKNSISSLFVSNMCEGKNGILWIGTQGGLNKLHKATGEFEVFKHDPNNANSLSANDVSAVMEDENGIVWIGTWGGGLNIFDPAHNLFYRYHHGDDNENGISYDVITKIFKDKQGNIWIGTWGGGLNQVVYSDLEDDTLQLEHLKFIQYKNNSSDPRSISGNSIYSIFEDQTGYMWVGTDWRGLNRFKPGGRQFKHIYAEKRDVNNIVSNIIHSLAIDENNKVWIGTDNGLNVYDRENNIFKLYQHKEGDKTSLSESIVRSVLRDHKNNIWIGTEDGLNKYDKKLDRFIHVDYIFDGLEKKMIRTMYESGERELWIGTNGNGVIRFNPETKKYTRYQKTLADTLSGLQGNTIEAFIEDRFNNLWIASEGGLCRYEKYKDKLTSFMFDANDSTSLSNNLVYSLYRDSDGNVWVGTRNGLNKMVYDDRGQVRFIRYNTEEGLSSETIMGIVEAKNKALWISTSYGLNHFDTKNNRFSRYYKADGLQDNQFTSAIIYDGRSNEILAGGINGLSIFNPESISEDEVLPNSKIVDLKLFHQSVKIGQEINGKVILHKDICYQEEIEFNENDDRIISFEYTALNSVSREGNLFAYILDGYEKDWNYVQDQRVATYRNLPPGNYTFKVKTASKGGEWEQEPAVLKVYIKPSWWNTIFFKISIVLLLIYLVYSAYLFRISFMKKRQLHLEEMVAQRTEELSNVNVLLEEKQEEITIQNEELVRHRNDLELMVQERTSELVKAKRKAEESDKLKSAFLANMSHEIRTPMNAIIGFSSILVDVADDKEEREYLAKMIKNSSDSLLTLINDIIDISRIEANQLVLYKENFCVNDVLKEIIAYFKIKNSKDIDIELVTSGEGVYLHSDPVRFRQIMINLIGNAIKFTDKGYVRFGFNESDKSLDFYVEDTGIGINAKDQEKIFNHFYKLEDKVRLYEGTGIGLSISQHLVYLMGGRLKLKSEPKKGSLFYFSLPKAANADSKVKKQDSHKNEMVLLEDLIIVVAEDESNNYYLLERLLKKTKAELYWAHNGQEAVDYVSNLYMKKKCLVLMDIKMPVMNGKKAAKKIKEINESIPIIAVTAFAQVGDKNKLLEKSFDGYLSKPINTEELFEMLQMHYSKL